MGESVEDPQSTAEFADLPDLMGLSLPEIAGSPAAVLVLAMLRLVEEAQQPQTTAGFGSAIT